MAVRVERQISSPFVRDIVDYWLALRGNRPAPQLNELDPLDIPKKSLPYILLSDLIPRPFRIRYRLVGTHSVGLFGDYKGMHLDELGLPDGLDELLTQDYGFSAWTCAPVLGSYPWPTTYGKPATVDYALLPLLRGDQVVRFLCGEHIGDQERGSYLYPEDLRPVANKASAA